MSDRLAHPRFPRAAAYHPDWVRAGVGGGANPLWLAEWLTEAVPLEPGMRVLDLGCGRGLSSVFLAREFGVSVWAADLWFDPTETHRRATDAGVGDRVFPLRADARALPFAASFFDALVSLDAAMYFATDPLILPALARVVRPGGAVGFALAGLTHEIDGPPPDHLREMLTAEPEMYSLHSAAWWRRHWERSGLLDGVTADDLPGGWEFWRDWHQEVAPDNAVELTALAADRGQALGYVRVVGRRTGRPAGEMTTRVATEYTRHPLLRG